MNIAERVKTVLDGRMPDAVPILIYSNHLPRGEFERNLRNIGLGLDVRCSVYRSYMPNVKVEERRTGHYVYTIYNTPKGSLSMITRVNLKFQLPGGSWIVEYLVKNIDDVKALKFIIEDTVYEANYEEYIQIKEDLEGDGIVTASSDYTPLMKIILRYMGFRNFAMMFKRRPDIIDDLVQTIDEKYAEMYAVIARSPAEIVRIGDNIDGVMISPLLFEKYCLPFYNKYCSILKASGKKVISHMDGRLRVLKDLISLTSLDAIEAFTPPPGGDLPLKEARESWQNKVIWMNFPEAVLLEGPEKVRDFTISLLRESAPGDRLIMSITEDIHPIYLKSGLRALVETVHKYGKLPIEIPTS
ncbi:MAG: uroporphyrinogen decarboxylase family protein [Candidatus Bathyarchaeia archaeon]